MEWDDQVFNAVCIAQIASSWDQWHSNIRSNLWQIS